MSSLCKLFALAIVWLVFTNLAIPDSVAEEPGGCFVLHVLPPCSLPVKVYLSAGGPSECTAAEVENAVIAAIDTWNDAHPTVDFFTYAGTFSTTSTICSGCTTDHRNVIRFWEETQSTNKTCSMVIEGFDQVEFDIKFDPYVDMLFGIVWSCDESINPLEFDFESFALHELGHALGLPHNFSSPTSVMRQDMPMNTIERELDSEDVMNLVSMYNSAYLNTDELAVGDLAITRVFQSATSTWDVTFDFTSNYLATAEVEMGAWAGCGSTVVETHFQSGGSALNHSLTVSGLPGGSDYAYTLAVAAPGETADCDDTVEGTLALTTSPISGVAAVADPLECSAVVSWKVNGAATEGAVLYRLKGTSTWSGVSDNPLDCPEDLTLKASFPMTPRKIYEYKVKCTVDGVPSESGIRIIKSGRCIGSEPAQGEGDDIQQRPKFTISAVPNPFNPQTTIRCSLARSGQVEITIYSTRGTRIRSLYSGVRDAGEFAVDWNGTTDTGRRATSGVYFAAVKSGGEVRTTKLVLLK